MTQPRYCVVRHLLTASESGAKEAVPCFSKSGFFRRLSAPVQHSTGSNTRRLPALSEASYHQSLIML